MNSSTNSGDNIIHTRETNKKRRPVIENLYDILYGEDETSTKGDEEVQEVSKSQFRSKTRPRDSFTVEEILDRRQEDGQYYYKVKWEGFPMDKCTWEPSANLSNVQAMLKAFNKKFVARQKATITIDKAPKPIALPFPKSSTKDIVKEIPPPMPTVSPVVAQKPQKASVKPRTPVPVRPPSPPVIILDKEEEPAPIQLPTKGHFLLGDKPECVVYSHRIDSAKGSVLYFKVKWRPRENGFIPSDGEYTNAELKDLHPRALVEFYEERLKFVAKSGPESSSAGPRKIHN